MLIEECRCKLCYNGMLPGVRSHIFSEFLLKETVSMSGKAHRNQRDNELMFTLSANDAVELFVGRNATEGLLKFIQKDELTEKEVEELKSKENPLTDTYLVCAACENNFNPVEVKFKSLYDKIITKAKVSPSIQSYPLSEDEKNWLDLFILMNVWRASSSDKIAWRLDEKKQICLTELMYKTFYNSSAQTVMEKFLSNRGGNKCFEILCFFVAGDEGSNPQNPNQNFIFINPNAVDPYLLAVNRLIIFLSPNNFNTASPPRLCEGFIDRGIFLNAINDRFHQIHYIQYDHAKELYKNTVQENVDYFVMKVVSVYSEIYKEVSGGKMIPPEKIEKAKQIALLNIDSIFKHGNSMRGLFYDIAVDISNEFNLRNIRIAKKD